jgi:hypothetical protein
VAAPAVSPLDKASLNVAEHVYESVRASRRSATRPSSTWSLRLAMARFGRMDLDNWIELRKHTFNGPSDLVQRLVEDEIIPEGHIHGRLGLQP